MMHRILFCCILSFCALFCVAGCAVQTPAPLQNSAQESFQLFKKQYCTPVSALGMSTSASLSWYKEKKSARVLLDFWGNFPHNTACAVFRMDAWSHLSGTLCSIVENSSGITALYLDPLEAYTSADPKNTYKLGLPLPLALSDIASLLINDFSPLISHSFDTAYVTNEGWVFSFAQGAVSRLQLDFQNRPLFMEGTLTSGIQNGKKCWRINFSHYEKSPKNGVFQASRLDIYVPPSSSGILRIKARELTLEPWQAKALQLKLPEHTKMLSLDSLDANQSLQIPEKP